jgi:hypothetical protein
MSASWSRGPRTLGGGWCGRRPAGSGGIESRRIHSTWLYLVRHPCMYSTTPADDLGRDARPATTTCKTPSARRALTRDEVHFSSHRAVRDVLACIERDQATLGPNPVNDSVVVILDAGECEVGLSLKQPDAWRARGRAGGQGWGRGSMRADARRQGAQCLAGVRALQSRVKRGGGQGVCVCGEGKRGSPLTMSPQPAELFEPPLDSHRSTSASTLARGRLPSFVGTEPAVVEGTSNRGEGKDERVACTCKPHTIVKKSKLSRQLQRPTPNPATNSAGHAPNVV